MPSADRRQPAATCTFALRLSDGRYVTDMAGVSASYSIDNAHLWLWPIAESDEERAARISVIVKRYPWLGRATAVRARS